MSLHDAVGKGDLEAVRRHLDSGVSVDLQTSEGWTTVTEGDRLVLREVWTALMLAVDDDKKEMAALLLERGANLDLQNKDGETALIRAVDKDKKEMATLLLAHGAKDDLHLATQRGDLEAVRGLLDSGVSVDLQRTDGETALMKAVEYDKMEVAALLLERGANVDLQIGPQSQFYDLLNGDGRTALMLAVVLERNKGGMASFLLAHGAITDIGKVSSENKQVLLASAAALDVEALGTMVASLAAPLAPAAALLAVTLWVEAARLRARTLRSSDPRGADEHDDLFVRLQLAAAAFLNNLPEQKEIYNGGYCRSLSTDEKVHQLLNSEDGTQALTIALRTNAKELFAQSVMQQHVERTWLGEFLLGQLTEPVFSCEGLVFWAQFVLLLLINLLLLPAVALYPPLGEKLKDCMDPFYLLDLPLIKFGLSSTANVALALVFTYIPVATLRTVPAVSLLLLWVVSALLWEFSQAKGDPRGYLANHFNVYDLAALLLSLATLLMVAVHMYDDEASDAWASMWALAVFFLWLRTVQVLLVSPTFGPYALMLNRMLFGDVRYFLVLLAFLLFAIAASYTVLLSGTDGAAACSEDLGGLDLPSTLVILVEATLTGDLFFECAHASSNAVAAWMLSFIFAVLTVVLLLNMLIAMMSKTFDNVVEALGPNYLFLFGQLCFSLLHEPPTPPPLNVLSWPYEAVMAVRWLLERIRKNGTSYSQMKDKKAPKGPSKGAKTVEEAKKERQALAAAIAEYIDNHQADVAQEERWRTTFQRKISENFRELRCLEEKTDKKLDNMQEKMNEKLDKILESIASAQAPRVQATLR
jgi:ankyrin repeat protein